MVTDATYYYQVVKITEEFLGPAAERFINRQIEFHLSKDPNTINLGDVAKLRDSVRVALGLLISDKHVVEDAVHKFDVLINK